MAVTNAYSHPTPSIGKVPRQTGSQMGQVALTSVAGLSVEHVGGNGIVKRTIFTLTAMALAVTHSTQGFGSQQLGTFPEGRINVLDCVCSFTSILTTSAEASTLNDGKTVSIGVGQVAVASGDAGVLSGTMMNFMPGSGQSVKTFTSGATTAGSATGFLAAVSAAHLAAIVDGTTTAVPIILNIGVPTDADIDGNATLAITGTVEFTWINTGDF